MEQQKQQSDSESQCCACHGEISGTHLVLGCRQYERVIYGDDAQIEEIEVASSDVVKEYCSQECATADREKWLSEEGVRAEFLGKNHHECCSRCGNPVNLAQFHLSFVEDVGEITGGSLVPEIEPISSTKLAILCGVCAPVPQML